MYSIASVAVIIRRRAGRAFAKPCDDADEKLDEAVYAKYLTLTTDDVKALAVDDKRLAALDARIHSEMDRVSQQLTAACGNWGKGTRLRSLSLARERLLSESG